MKTKLIAALIVGATVLPALQGCFPMVATGITSGVLATVDRRSLGTQTEDESIEWKASSRVSEKLGDQVHTNFTSFNRKVLLTGEVPTAEAKAQAETIVSGVTNVQGVYNELVVGPVSNYSNRSNDSYITSKVKSRLVDEKTLSANHIKVVTESSVTYLMGIVGDREAKVSVIITRTTDGVSKVVNLMEVVSDAEIKRLDTPPGGAKPTGTPPAPVENRQ